jgi:dihydrolipoamide dehydrogenase
MTALETFDIIVIGGGPGGYVGAIRAAQLGFKTACIDAWSDAEGKPSLGGTCLNVGCIPSKALLDSSEKFEMAGHEFVEHGISLESLKMDIGKMQGRKNKVVSKLTGGIAFLFKKNKITSIHGYGMFKRRENDLWIIGVGDQEYAAKKIMVATGSAPRGLDLAPVDNLKIVDNVGALEFEAVPQKLGVIGAGVIGLELGSVWRRLGAAVTILEAAPGFLAAADDAVAKEALKLFKKQGLDFHFGVKITQVDTSGAGVTVTYEEAGEVKTAEFDKLIVSVGRVPYTANLGAEQVGLELDERGFIKTHHYQTNLEGVYAVGDVIGGAMLAHKAEDEGIAVAEIIAGQAGHVNYDAVPWVIYTSPEIAWAGKTEAQLKLEGISYKTGQFPFAANGRAIGHNDTRGFVKVIADAQTDRLLGVHMVGPNVSELISEAVVVMEFGGSAEDLARTIHAHPTLSEAVKEAAMGVAKRTISA